MEGFGFSSKRYFLVSDDDDTYWIVLGESKEPSHFKSALNTTDKTLHFTFLTDKETFKNTGKRLKRMTFK